MSLNRRITGILALSLVLSACGSGSGGDSGASSGGTSEKAEISYAIWDKNDQPGTLKIIEAFEKKNPTIKVKLEVTPWDQYWTKLQTAVTGGAAPDVFWMNPLNLRLYAKSGVILPVDESKIDLSGFPQPIVDSHRYEGKLYGTPRDLSVTGLWYNKELFDQAGVKYPTADWTWDDFRAAAQKLTIPDKKQYGFLSYRWDQGGFYNTIFQAGGYVISPDGKKSGYDDPNTIKGLEFWTDLIAKDKVSPSAQVMSDSDLLALFMSGKYAMAFGGSWFGALYKANTETGKKVDIAPLPKGPAKAATVMMGLSNVVWAKGKHQEQSAEFARFLATEEALKILSESGGASLPALPSARDAYYKSFPDYHLKEMVDASVPNGVPFPVSINTAKWLAVQDKLLPEAWAGTRPTADVAKEIATQMNEILAKE
ncbi:ABC transporter substrate-binding protein [Nonomuraea sp. NPDC050328]|uniref:ABC transporter substrate-binding protein n=1 Tax=Nonomuraea sp. NPDC050328 TaxID=3364361 RepID=UPI0037951D91